MSDESLRNAVVWTGEGFDEETREEVRRLIDSRDEKEPPIIRVRIFKKALNGEFVLGHYEDFQLANLGELAAAIEKYVQLAIGANLREI